MVWEETVRNDLVKTGTSQLDYKCGCGRDVSVYFTWELRDTLRKFHGPDVEGTEEESLGLSTDLPDLVGCMECDAVYETWAPYGIFMEKRGNPSTNRALGSRNDVDENLEAALNQVSVSGESLGKVGVY